LGRRIGRDRAFASAAAQLIEQRWIQAPRIEDRFEPPRREFLDLLVRQLDAAALRDPAADVAHDLLDVHAIGALGAVILRIGRRALPALRPAPIGAAASAVEVPPASLLIVIHRHRVSTF
jgi:hypothetical protein